MSYYNRLPDGYVIKININGFNSEEVTVQTDDRYVIVTGEHEERLDGGSGYLARHFAQRFLLPRNVDAEALTTNLSEDGILMIHAPLKRYALQQFTYAQPTKEYSEPTDTQPTEEDSEPTHTQPDEENSPPSVAQPIEEDSAPTDAQTTEEDSVRTDVQQTTEDSGHTEAQSTEEDTAPTETQPTEVDTAPTETQPKTHYRNTTN